MRVSLMRCARVGLHTRRSLYRSSFSLRWLRPTTVLSWGRHFSTANEDEADGGSDVEEEVAEVPVGWTGKPFHHRGSHLHDLIEHMVPKASFHKQGNEKTHVHHGGVGLRIYRDTWFRPDCYWTICHYRDANIDSKGEVKRSPRLYGVQTWNGHVDSTVKAIPKQWKRGYWKLLEPSGCFLFPHRCNPDQPLPTKHKGECMYRPGDDPRWVPWFETLEARQHQKVTPVSGTDIARWESPEEFAEVMRDFPSAEAREEEEGLINESMEAILEIKDERFVPDDHKELDFLLEHLGEKQSEEEQLNEGGGTDVFEGLDLSNDTL